MRILPRIGCRITAAVFAAAAFVAAGHADPYKVKDLVVDKTAASAPQAIQEGRVASRIAGAQRLIERLTLPEDRQAARQPLEASDIARLYKTFDVQAQEKTFAVPGGTRVNATLAWNYDATPIRKYLDDRGVPFVDNQAAKALLVPSVTGGVDSLAWWSQWTSPPAAAGGNPTPKSDDTLLTPYVASTQTWDRHPGWNEVQAETARNAASRAIIAEAYNQGGQYYVRLSDLRANSQETAIGVAGPFGDLSSAQAGTLAALEYAWKVASIVRTTGSTSMSLVASFRDIGEWVRIKKSLEASRLISGLNIESISATGADISFVFAGRPDQLAGDLRSRGVELSGAGNGWMLQAASQQ